MKSYKIMLIDDDTLIAEMICKALEKQMNFKTCYFESSVEAFKKIPKIKPDMILLDWKMPKFSGLQFLLRLRKDKAIKHIPVFMLTGKKTGHDFELACEAGVDGYFTKPIDWLVFNRRILKHLQDREEYAVS